MTARHYRELVTWQLADELESETIRIMKACPKAMDDIRYRGQVFEAATGGPSNIAEGFSRKSPGDFCRFLDYAIASIDEAALRLQSGVKRDYFTEETIQPALALVRRTRKAAIRLKQTQIDLLEKRKAETRRARRPKPDRET